MATDPSQRPHKKSKYTADRGIPGAYEGETVTRRALFSGGALAAGGIASAAFRLPALGFALGPVFKKSEPVHYEDVGPEADFNPQTYVPRLITLVSELSEVGTTTIYVQRLRTLVSALSEVGNSMIYARRKYPTRDTDKLNYPYIAISTRCAHLGCPVRYVQAAERFICPCHGGVSPFDGKVAGGPPGRPLERFETKVQNGRVLVGPRFSLNSQLVKFHARDPSNHLDGLWHYLYPSRPTT